MKQVFAVSILLILIGCSSTKPTTSLPPPPPSLDVRWASRFSTEEKIQLLHERGLRRFQDAKQLTSREHLQKARDDFQFLQQEFGDTLAARRLKELEEYEQNVIAYYTTAAQEAIAKNQLADAAGYYKLLLRFDSSQTAASEFIEKNKAEIEKQLQEIRATGDTYLKKKQYVKAKKVYERLWLIAYSPDIDSTLKSINTLKAQQDKRRQQALKAAIQRDNSEMLSNEDEIERIYIEAKRAFERKDYLKAYSLFSSIQRSYKDTSLYIERAADKIEALNLNEETN
jgi:tetratricopeptide (TPR) repeat protein